MASLSEDKAAPEPRMGKHDYEWFAEEDLLRQVDSPPTGIRLCQNWAVCRREEPVEAPEKVPPARLVAYLVHTSVHTSWPPPAIIHTLP